MRLSLSNANSQIFVFRPKVDKISHLIVNFSLFVTIRSLLLCFGSRFWLLENKLALAHSITHEETVKACTSQINGTSMRCTNAANTCRKNMEYLEFEEGLILVQRVATPYAIRWISTWRQWGRGNWYWDWNSWWIHLGFRQRRFAKAFRGGGRVCEFQGWGFRRSRRQLASCFIVAIAMVSLCASFDGIVVVVTVMSSQRLCASYWWVGEMIEDKVGKGDNEFQLYVWLMVT